MKSFLKYTLATIVGIMIVHVILFFIFIGFIGAIASFSEKTVTVKNNSILTIKLEGEILDRTSDNPLDNIDFLSFTPKKNLGGFAYPGNLSGPDRNSGKFRSPGLYSGNPERFTKIQGKRKVYLQLFESGIFPKKLLSGYRCRQNLCKPRNTFVVNRNEQ